jgi:hypothetical protein
LNGWGGVAKGNGGGRVQSDSNPGGDDQARWTTLKVHKRIVVLLVTALVILIIVILVVPPPHGDDAINATAAMEFQKGNLSLVITAFSAWIAAAVTFLFSADAMKAYASATGMTKSPEDRLWDIAVGKMKLKTISRTFRIKDHVKEVNTWLENNPELTFITVVEGDGILKNIVHKEAMANATNIEINRKYRELEEREATTLAVFIDKVNEMTLGSLIEETMQNPERRKKYLDIYVKTDPYTTLGLVYKQLKNQELGLGIVVDDAGKPTHYFTIEDIKQVMVPLA